MQDLLPPDTAVSGCVVLAYEEGGVGGERGGVRVYNHDTFRDQFLKTLVAEKGDECVVDGRVANAVWRLSRGEAVEQEEAAAPKDGTPGSPIATWQGRAGRAR